MTMESSENTLAPCLQVKQLKKLYGSEVIVDSLSFDVYPGELFALLGPNGAGKTTTLKMIAGLEHPSSGEIWVSGYAQHQNALEVKKRLAYLPDDPLLYPKLTPLEYLEFMAGLWGMKADVAWKEAEELLRYLDLWTMRDRYTETLSRGMQQKLAFAAGLIHRPELLMLDEPLTGLDAHAAHDVKQLLAARAKEDGMAVVFTTHILDMAERWADRLALLHKGHLIALGKFEDLKLKRAEYESMTLEQFFLECTARGDS
ncbi:MAG: ABC transporter ATP-binding protein [Pseudomonadota bacterium]